jgi:HPt (histidine-containing phosphotransfer) domain-containing protein
MQGVAQRDFDPDLTVAPATRAGGPVDLVHLRRFTLGNQALEREVLQLFADQAPVILRRMELARTDKAWRDAAHTLKGSAGAVGAHAVARAAAEAELLRGDETAWPAGIARVRLALDEACSFIGAGVL